MAQEFESTETPRPRRLRKPKLFAVLPTMLTLGNAACGFGAITFAAKVGPEAPDANFLIVSALLIFAAMLFDMLDGSAARWTNQQTEFGAQLDSLCDGISFGVAPAFLMIQFIKHDHTSGGRFIPLFEYHPRLLWVIAALYTICALLRLARFNVETDEDDSHDSFSGLPSPAAAGTVASFPLAMRGLKELATSEQAAIDRATAQAIASFLVPTIEIVLPLITFAVACLMVSRIRYAHVFNQLFKGQRNRKHVMQLVFAGMVIYLVKEMAVPLIFCYFAFASPLKALWLEVMANRRGKLPTSPPANPPPM